ncbi:hypothetical protein [Methanolacinia petrolearia]|uniref:hypothetical protein n=1 Tax=Methanolacinia petrolearia TaxID=54120 RepID=UPI003BADA8B5
MASVSDFIELAPNENVVKEYRSFRMKKPQNATVNIAATNMRLILYGQSSRERKTGRPTLTQEIRIEDIRGVEIYEKERPRIILIIVGLFFLTSAGLLAADRLPSVYRILEGILGNGSYGVLITAAVGIAIFASAFYFRNREFEILVKANNNNLNTGMFSEKTVFKQGIDSPKILRELGSIVIQIQKDKEKNDDNSSRHKQNFHSYHDERKTGVGDKDTYEEEIESIFEVDEIPRKTPGTSYGTAYSEQQPAPAYEENSRENSGDFKDIQEQETEQENAKEQDKQSGSEIIEEYYDRGREKVNVDDILNTMEKIENPTSKKKDDFMV